MLKFNLRPHHLLCLNFYSGKGYNKVFNEQIGYIYKNLAYNPEIKIVKGHDCLCYSCPNMIENICKDHNKVLKYDTLVLDYCNITYDSTYYWEDINKIVNNKIILNNRLISICSDCCWFDICNNKFDLTY